MAIAILDQDLDKETKPIAALFSIWCYLTPRPSREVSNLIRQIVKIDGYPYVICGLNMNEEHPLALVLQLFDPREKSTLNLLLGANLQEMSLWTNSPEETYIDPFTIDAFISVSGLLNQISELNLRSMGNSATCPVVDISESVASIDC